MNKRTTTEQLKAAPCVGLNTPAPGAESTEFDEVCRAIATIKRIMAKVEDECASIARLDRIVDVLTQVRRLQTDYDVLVNSIAGWQNEVFRLNLELTGIGVCPACETEFVQQIEEPVVSCDCGYGTWQGALPFIHRLRQEVETVISRLWTPATNPSPKSDTENKS